MKNTLLISSSLTLRQKLSFCIASVLLLAGFVGPHLTEYSQQHPYSHLGVVTASMPNMKVEVSPNPSSEMVHIDVDGWEGTDTAVKIVDMLGKTKYSHPLPEDGRVSLDVSKWAKGIYIVQLENDPSMTAKRLTVN